MTFKIILSYFIMLLLSSSVALYFVHVRKQNLIGNLYGALIIAFIGAFLANYLLNPIINFFIENFNIQILSVILGAYVFLVILKKVTP